MAELVGAVASPLVEGAKLVFGHIYRNTKSFFKLQSNLSSLQQKKTVLKEMEDGMKQELEAADKDGKSATPRVKEWLRQVGGILADAEKMEPGMIADNRGLVSGCFLSCGVCRKGRKNLEEVERLIHVCPAERVVATIRPPRMVEHIPSPSIEDQTTASQNLNRVIDSLIRDEVVSVGIWGMGGVGKTTLVKNLNNKLKSGGSSGRQFGMVIWATVSKDFNLKRIQEQIADRLGMELGLRDDEDRNAVKLHERLMKENKFLLILDDLWEAIDLDKLGIPKPRVHNGVKILITSRSKRVCETMKTDEQLQVVVLNQDEAWELFVKTVGSIANLEGIKPIAWKVCEQCCGLPLAVVIVGAAMRGKDKIPLWEDALSELQRSTPSIENVEEKVFIPLKWSYDKLQGDVKSCFLYCCLYPEDFCIKISELVKCWMGEGLIDKELNYEKSRNRGLALIQSLKEACLLEDGEPFLKEGETVKMHDVVRDVAIWISSNHLEDGCKFLVRTGIGLTQLSQVKFSNEVKRISFMNNKIDRLPCDDACLKRCSNASTLFLQGNRSLVEIPREFLRRFQAIKVLNLSDTNIISLPPSIMKLSNLETLVARGCEKLEKLPTSGWEGLGRLQILDLAYTAIWELPNEMARLIKLRELDVFATPNLKSIPVGVFSMLSSLEILDMERSRYIWGSKGAVEDGEAYLEELESLDTLLELFIQVKPNSSASWMINPTWIENLRRFTLCISVMPQSFDYSITGREKQLIMNGCDHTEEKRTEYLLSTTNATSLWFYESVGLDKWVQNMGLHTNVCFSAVKFLDIQRASINLRETLGGGCRSKHDLLPNLQTLSLQEVSGMRNISELAGHLGLTFSKLQHLWVSGCNEMKHLFSVGHHLILESLTKMNIDMCRELDEVFEHAPLQDSGSICIVPNLKEVYLLQLPKLRTLCNNNKSVPWSGLEIISVIGCDQVRKLPISGTNNSIKKIIGKESWWSNLEWDDLDTKTSLQHLFEIERL